jgi:hypothetical protein
MEIEVEEVKERAGHGADFLCPFSFASFIPFFYLFIAFSAPHETSVSARIEK